MRCISLYTNDLTYERIRTKDYVRNFNLFMQNKPNFQKPKITINYCTKRTYKDFLYSEHPKNKPKTNPIQSQFKPNLKNAKIKLIPYLKMGYSNFRCFEPFKNKPKRTQNKPNFKSPAHPVLQNANCGFEFLVELILRLRRRFIACRGEFNFVFRMGGRILKFLPRGLRSWQGLFLFCLLRRIRLCIRPAMIFPRGSR